MITLKGLIWLKNSDQADMEEITSELLFIQNVKDLANNIWFCKIHVNLLDFLKFLHVKYFKMETKPLSCRHMQILVLQTEKKPDHSHVSIL